MKTCSEIIFISEEILKKTLLEDFVLEAQLHFSAMIFEELEEFLTCFQRNDLLLPFLHQEVFHLKKNILSMLRWKRFAMPDSIEVGFGTTFCQKKLYSKLEEKSPLRMRIVLGSTCLSPSVMIKDIRSSRAKLFLSTSCHLQMGMLFLREYANMCALPEVSKAVKFFNWKKDSLDKFLFQLLNLAMEDAHKQFVFFIQCFLVCFHGNAAVERSFSCNKEFLQDKSLVAQILLHDHISSLPAV
ncbi:hypothetical protein PR048_012291 [Dryococelus australis]|uniref:HAT C-terminal dimerisation domain-containing protein n=1 Tax=Dryococelus australis TaxID=614101 RepID=A0ABQ9HP08_9NEOP|nr:hypothetical protein PR048_012291 [Dryococelus australis]